MITQIIMPVILMGIVPVVVGTLFKKVNTNSAGIPFFWVSGQMLLWAGFQLVSVPLILFRRSFTQVCGLYSLFVAGMVILAAAVWLFERMKIQNGKKDKAVEGTLEKERPSKGQVILWLIFAIILLGQILTGLFMAYEEGDDAFYVALSTSTEKSDAMYQTLPYTGMSTGLDARHGLAPFPIWIAYLARMAGMPAVTMAQVVVPIMILGLTYVIFYLLAKYLFDKEKEYIPFFMILILLFYLFGGYSNYSAENFLLVRATQGKAVIANVIIPMLVYLLFLLLGYMKEEKKAGMGFWLLLVLTMIAGCLCSTLGCLLTCMLIGIVGLCAVVVYRRWKILLPLAGSCILPMLFALLYFVLR